MIECVVHEAGNEEDEPIGGGFSTFKFNSLPKVGDIVWLMIGDGNQLNCVVTYSAQWCSNLIEYNKGYLVVNIDRS